MNVTRHLTRNPRTRAGKALRGLVMQLGKVYEEEQAIEWQIRLNEWWQTFGYLTKERILLRDGRFGFTHDKLRKAWLRVRNVVRQGTLFAYITYGNPRTASPLEGGVNAQIRALLKRHRGMSEEHRRRAAEWFLVLHELDLKTAVATANREAPRKEPVPGEPEGSLIHDVGLEAAEGLWIRAGWAGRG